MDTEGVPRGGLKDPLQTEKWMCLVEIIQQMWRMGKITQELGWNVLVLIPKGTIDTRGISLLETLWKLVEALIDTCIRASLQFHNLLHVLLSRRGTRTDIMDLNLSQELARISYNPLFQVLIDLRKAHNTVDRYCLIQTLEVYSVVPYLCGILETF